MADYNKDNFISDSEWMDFFENFVDPF